MLGIHAVAQGSGAKLTEGDRVGTVGEADLKGHSEGARSVGRELADRMAGQPSPQETTQLPAADRRADPQQKAPGAAGSLTDSSSVAVPALSSIS